MTKGANGAAGSHGVASLVAALRAGNAAQRDVPSVRRSANLDALLPEGHRARLIWDYVAGGPARDAGRMAHFEEAGAAPGALPPAVLLALWVYANDTGVGSAPEIALLCRSHAGFRWLCGGAIADPGRLVEFRMQSPRAVDELLAECLAGLAAAGADSGWATRRDPEREDSLIDGLHEAQQRVQALRERIEQVPGERFARRANAAEARRELRQKKVAAALMALQRLDAVQTELERREDEARLRAKKASVRKPLVITVPPVLGPEPVLPWNMTDDSDGRYRRFLAIAAGVLLVVSSVLLFVNLPPVERAEAEKIPPRLVKLALERRELPKPVPVKTEEVRQVEQKVDESKTSTESREAQAPARAGGGGKPTSQQVADARARAATTGLVAMRDQLVALRALSSRSVEAVSVDQASVGLAGSSPGTDRDLIGNVATAGSGGVAGRGVAYGGGGSLEGHRTTTVRGGSGGGTLAAINKEAKSGKRGSEDIKLGFDANKSALYAIYRRALRENPALEGRVVLKLSIDASGQVLSCSVASSALKDPALEEKLVARVLLINFGARAGVETWNGTYHIDFVPSS